MAALKDVDVSEDVAAAAELAQPQLVHDFALDGLLGIAGVDVLKRISVDACLELSLANFLQVEAVEVGQNMPARHAAHGNDHTVMAKEKARRLDQFLGVFQCWLVQYVGCRGRRWRPLVLGHNRLQSELHAPPCVNERLGNEASALLLTRVRRGRWHQ